MRNKPAYAIIAINLSFVALGLIVLWRTHGPRGHLPPVRETELRQIVASKTTQDQLRATCEALIKMYSGAAKALSGFTSTAELLSVAIILIGIANVFFTVASLRQQRRHESRKTTVT